MVFFPSLFRILIPNMINGSSEFDHLFEISWLALKCLVSANLGESNREKIRHAILESSFFRTLQLYSTWDALCKDYSIVPALINA